MLLPEAIKVLIDTNYYIHHICKHLIIHYYVFVLCVYMSMRTHMPWHCGGQKETFGRQFFHSTVGSECQSWDIRLEQDELLSPETLCPSRWPLESFDCLLP